jgi:cell division protease FtsH
MRKNYHPVNKQPPANFPNSSRFFRGLLFWIIVILMISYVLRYVGETAGALPQEKSYSEFYSLLKEKKVKTAVMVADKITGELNDASRYIVNVPPIEASSELIKDLRENVQKDFKIEPPRTFWVNILYALGQFALFFFLFWFFFYRGAAQGGGKIWSFGKSQARLVTAEQMRITFKDVAGVDEAKEELQEVILFLKDPKKFTRLGGRIPKGVLLVGPPGTGKTLLAKAVAGEAGVPFFSISGSDFVEMFVGVGASRVRDLFDQGKKSAKVMGKGCIIFIDEIDAVGRQRFAGIGGGHDEREQTLNALLVEMDGFDTQEGVILIAATNRPDVLDPALLRPGRFDRRIVIDRPDLVGREAILKVHTRRITLDKNVDLKATARQTAGFSGADLANLANEAALLAARNNKEAVGMEELQAAVERVIAGPERKSRVISKQEKEVVAYHESGHALLSVLIPGADPLHKVSIIPRGMALGYTMQLPIEDRYIATENELKGKITGLLGGRVSEELIFKEISTGAQNDLEVATMIARRMVCEFGMSKRLGHLTLGHREQQIFLGRDLLEERNYSDQTALIIDEEVRAIIDECYIRAREELTKHREQLKMVAEELLEKEVLDGEIVKQILAGTYQQQPKPPQAQTENSASS